MEAALRVIKNLIPGPLFRRLQPIYHWALALAAALFYFFPSRKLKVIGVTGTDGKSSVVELLREILFLAGRNVASASSLHFKINDREEPNLRKMTMPGRFFMQRFLRRAAKSGVQYAVLEVTSEGIKQSRHRFIKFDVAVLTNVTPEHIESHGSFEKYRRTKAKLFAALGRKGTAVLNRDDAAWEYFSASARGTEILYGTTGIKVAQKTYPVENVSFRDKISFTVDGVPFRSRLFGEFNVSNILAAVSATRALGLTFQETAEALAKIPGIPGRLEVVQEEPFQVIVDYAHTPNALRNVYQTLRNANPKPARLSPKAKGVVWPTLNPKLICVLGAAGGGRDKWKRPEFGKIAAEFCDESILTNEDPYDESPHEIIDQIESGLSQTLNPKPEALNKPKTPNYKKILDRREAIRKALQAARPGDTVIITGKGAEQWIMGPSGTKIPWDDRKVVREEWERIGK